MGHVRTKTVKKSSRQVIDPLEQTYPKKSSAWNLRQATRERA